MLCLVELVWATSIDLGHESQDSGIDLLDNGKFAQGFSLAKCFSHRVPRATVDS